MGGVRLRLAAQAGSGCRVRQLVIRPGGFPSLPPCWLRAAGPGCEHGKSRLDGESERRAAHDVERQVGADIDTGQGHGRGGAQDQHAPGPAEAGQRGRAEGECDAGVTREVSQPGGSPAAAAGTGKQGRWAVPADHVFDPLGEYPGD